MASMTYIPTRTLLRNRSGSFLSVNVPGFSSLGNTSTSRASAMMETIAMTTNVILHPRASPMILPSGRPTIMATDVPVATALMASFCRWAGTMRTASGVAMDQKIEWATATPIREAMSIQ